MTRVRTAVAGILAGREWWNDHGWPKYYERCEAP
jgi:hypothetical protein